MTCWRRLRDWNEAGVWQRMHLMILEKLSVAGQINWDHASIDASLVPAKHGGTQTGKNPTDRGKPGSKRHLVDQSGYILVADLTAANVNETILLPDVASRAIRISGASAEWLSTPLAWSISFVGFGYATSGKGNFTKRSYISLRR